MLGIWRGEGFFFSALSRNKAVLSKSVYSKLERAGRVMGDAWWLPDPGKSICEIGKKSSLAESLIFLCSSVLPPFGSSKFPISVIRVIFASDWFPPSILRTSSVNRWAMLLNSIRALFGRQSESIPLCFFWMWFSGACVKLGTYGIFNWCAG